MKPALSHLPSNQKGRYKASRFRKPAGFSMVGVLVASTVGAMAVLGLSQLSTIVARKALRSQQMFNFILLSEEIKQTLMLGKPPGCISNCYNACTNSIADNTVKNFIIRSSSSSGIGAGDELYKGGELKKGIRIQEIKYTPGPSAVPPLPPEEGWVSVHFSLSDDTRETLVTPPSLGLHIMWDSGTGDCHVAEASFAGHGPPDIAHGCRRVELEQSLIGCGDTIDNRDLKGTAFGYRSGFQNLGEGNTFFGHQAGRDNTTGKENTAVGYGAGEKTTGDPGDVHKGSYNTFIGNKAGSDNETGLYNIAIGGIELNTIKGKVENTERMDMDGDECKKLDPTECIKINADSTDYIAQGPAVVEDSDYQLNIGNLIKGRLHPDAKGSILPPPPNPEVIFKAPVKIEPPSTGNNLKVHGAVRVIKKVIPAKTNPPDTTNPTLPRVDTTDASSTLNIPHFTISAKYTPTSSPPPPDLITGSPTMYLLAHGMTIEASSGKAEMTVEGSDYKDPGLNIQADLKAGDPTTPDDSSKPPGLEIRGKWDMKARSGSPTVTAEAKGGDPGLLNISGHLKVEASETDADDRESLFEKNLRVTNTLEVLAEYLGDPTRYPNDKAEFQELRVNNRVDFDNNPNNITAKTADIEDLQVATKADITKGDIQDPLIIPTGSLSPHGHKHDTPYHANPSDPHPGEYLLLSSGHTATTTGCPTALPPCAPPCGSSRTLKRNIKPFKSYEKSLENILNTPLFTYQYKEGEGSHPDKVRMGIISEELPKSLQILTEVDSENHKPENPQTAKNKKKNRKKISTPDWLSIYGTLWAGVKALAQKLQNVTEESGRKLVELSQELKTHFSEALTQFKDEAISRLADTEKQLEKLGKKAQKQKQQAHQNSQEFEELKKQFQQTEFILKNSEKELKTLQKELKNAREQLKKILSRKKRKSVSELKKKESVTPASAGVTICAGVCAPVGYVLLKDIRK